jgi:hypothetical protein
MKNNLRIQESGIRMRVESPCDGWEIEGSGESRYFVGDYGFWVVGGEVRG